MANFCSNCGKQLYPNEDRCPACGMYIAEERRENVNNENNHSGSYQNGGQNYNGGQGYNNNAYNGGQNYNNGGYNNGGYNNGGYAPNYYVPPQTPVKRPLNVGLLIFSIANIFLGCCGIGMILGIAALVVTINATNSQTDVDERSKLNTALILNVVAIVLLALAVVYIAVLVGLSM